MKNLFTLLLLCAAFAVNAQLKFSGTWELSQGALSNMGFVEGCCSYSVTRSTEQAATGLYSGRFELRHSDPVTNSKRAEQGKQGYNSTTPDQSLRWWTFKTFLPVGRELDVKEFIFAQWHDEHVIKPAPCSASPTLAFEIINDQYRIKTRYSTADYCVVSNRKERAPVYLPGNVIEGVWVTWVVDYDVAMNGAPTGNIRIWKNQEAGKPADEFVKVFELHPDGAVLTAANASNTYVNSKFPYPKIGLYIWNYDDTNGPRGATSSKQIMYIDDYKIYGRQSTFNEVIGAPTVNILPTVNVGASADLAYTATTFTRTATDADQDGTVPTRGWTWLQGPNTPTMVTGSTTAALSLSGMVPGVYKYRYSVTDNSGGKTSADLQITVADPPPPIPNAAPVINVSMNTNQVGPTGTLTLLSNVTDADGTFTVAWEKRAGPAALLATPFNTNTQVTGLTSGNYLFILTVTDDKGAVTTAEVSISVSPLYLFIIDTGSKIIIR